MQILADDIDMAILEKYKGRVLGFYKDGILISSKANTRNSIALAKNGGINPVILKCKSCNKDMGDNSIILAGKSLLIDKNCNVIDSDVDIGYTPVYSIILCQSCTKIRMAEIAGTLMCEACGKQVAWLEAGTTADGFEIKAGTVYHSYHCNNCQPEVSEHQIKEMVERDSQSSVQS